MNLNILKKNNDPVVEQSLETTRNIEFQLLNMKKELDKFSKREASDIDVTPQVFQTLETLQQIDTQLQNMCSILEGFTNNLKDKTETIIEKTNEQLDQDGPQNQQPSPPGKPPTFPPTFPPTYPNLPNENLEEPYYLQDYPPWEEHEQYWPHEYYQRPLQPWYEYQHYPHYYDSPYYRPTPYGEYYSRNHDPYYQEPYYPRPHSYPPFHHPPERHSYYRSRQSPYPVYGEPPRDYSSYEDRYYQSTKYPTVANSEPAYSSKFKAVPSATFKIAYYPWQQITGRRKPTNSRTPYMNIYDLGNEYMVYFELPGVEKDNLELRVDEQALWITGKPTIVTGMDGQPVVQEHGYHEFYRQVNLPSKVIQNKTTCLFENGILKIKLVKNSPKQSVHKVNIE